METRELVELEIRSNNAIFKEVCFCCGEIHDDSHIPFWIFEKDTSSGICQRCAEQHSPEMHKEVLAKNRKFLIEEWGFLPSVFEDGFNEFEMTE